MLGTRIQQHACPTLPFSILAHSRGLTPTAADPEIKKKNSLNI